MILSVPGEAPPTYDRVQTLARELTRGSPAEVLVCLEADMAKALGHALSARLPENARILCIDRVRALPDTYLDIGAPVGGAFPVVLKTLVLERSRT